MNNHLNQRQLSHHWGVSQHTLARWRCHGKGPTFLKINGHVMYRQDDIQRYEEECLRKSTSERTSNGASI